MDDALVQYGMSVQFTLKGGVLILVLMDDALVHLNLVTLD